MKRRLCFNNESEINAVVRRYCNDRITLSIKSIPQKLTYGFCSTDRLARMSGLERDALSKYMRVDEG